MNDVTRRSLKSRTDRIHWSRQNGRARSSFFAPDYTRPHRHRGSLMRCGRSGFWSGRPCSARPRRKCQMTLSRAREHVHAVRPACIPFRSSRVTSGRAVRAVRSVRCVREVMRCDQYCALWRSRARERESESRDPKWGLIGPGSGTSRMRKAPRVSKRVLAGVFLSLTLNRYDSENSMPLKSGVEYVL